MKKKTRTIIIVAAAVAAVAIAFMVFGASRKKGGITLSVPMSTVTRGALEERVSAAGSFQAERYSIVSSQTIGIVKSVSVKPGDHVEKDDLILVVDERDARQALESAQIALEETKRSLAVELATLRASVRQSTLANDQAERAAVNAEALKAVQGISEEDYRKAIEERDRTRYALADSRERLRVTQGLPVGAEPSLESSGDGAVIASSPSSRRAQLAVETARRALDGCVFRAERSGIVTEIGVAPGDRLLNETKVARIEDPLSVIAEVKVDEVDVGKIDEGMAVEITSDSMLGKTLSGSVRRIWPIVKSDGNGRICTVWISLDLDGMKLLSGASCMARITSRLKDDVLMVPASALIPGAGKSAVWVATEIAASPASQANPDTDNATVAPVDATSKDAAPADATSADAATADATPADNKKSAKKSAKGAVKKMGDVPAVPEKLYTCTRREITLGASTVSTIEVLSGLSEGEFVIVDQLPMISEGMTVSNGSRKL
jgi:HlyD family secretion protein/macrolide-specific efflux system membrane fusion protein